MFGNKSYIIISGGGPHCGGCDGLRRRRSETKLSGAGMCGISVGPSLIVYNYSDNVVLLLLKI